MDLMTEGGLGDLRPDQPGNSEGRKKLLFLGQNLPYPPDGGALIRTYHTLRILCEEYEVNALLLYRASRRRTPGAVEDGLRHLRGMTASVNAFPIPQESSRLRLLADHLLSLLTSSVYTRWAYSSRPFRRELRRLLKNHTFDLIHADSLDLVAYFPDLPHPLVVAHHNVESQLLERRSKVEGGLRGRYIRWQAELVRRTEARWCPAVDLNLVVSEEDLEQLGRISPKANFLVVPNGVDTDFFFPEDGGEKSGVVFLGGATWFPNLDGMEWFASEILPLIRKERPQEKVVWIGRMDEEQRSHFEALGIEVTGYVEDIRPVVEHAACSVVPLRVGGGTRLKILDAWAMGKAVVSTPQGCEGLGATDGEDMLIATDAPSFAQAVIRVLEDEALRDKLGRAGRAMAVERFDWRAIGKVIHEHYRRLS